MQSWALGSWLTDAARVVRTTAFATDGRHGLEITTAGDGWFGPTFATPLDLATVKRIKVDVRTDSIGTSQSIAVQVGADWKWCQTEWGWIDADTVTTIDVDLPALFAACGVIDPSALQGLYVYFSPGGVYGLDYLRKE